MSVEAVVEYLKESKVDETFINSVMFQIKKHKLKGINSHYELAILIQKELNIIINNYDTVEPEQVRRWLLKIAGMVLLHFAEMNEPTKLINVGMYSNDETEKGMSVYLSVARIQAFTTHIFNASIQRFDVCREYALIFDLCYSVNRQ